MAAKIRWNIKGFQALRTEPRMHALVDAKAKAIADACNAELGKGPGHFVAAPSQGERRRARAAVIAVTVEARKHNARNNTILRHLSAAR